MAQDDCGKDPQLKYQLGGTFHDPGDHTTFWSGADQFFTWWKNNVERKSKFKSLIVDANYEGVDYQLLFVAFVLVSGKKTITLVGPDITLCQRKLYCQNVVALTTNIKKKFDRHHSNANLRLQTVPLSPPFRPIDKSQSESACSLQVSINIDEDRDLPTSISMINMCEQTEQDRFTPIKKIRSDSQLFISKTTKLQRNQNHQIASISKQEWNQKIKLDFPNYTQSQKTETMDCYIPIISPEKEHSDDDFISSNSSTSFKYESYLFENGNL